MGGIQHSKTQNQQKPFPGCLGRMVNLFDLNTGVARNSLLMDKQDLNGSSLSRSQSNVSHVTKMRSIGEPIEDTLMVSELRRTSSNRKANETPIKMLIAQEVSKEVESKQNPSNVVAKLMGLDVLPLDQDDAAVERSHSRGYSQNPSCRPLNYWQQECGFAGTQKEYRIHQYSQQNECKDAYEICPQSQNTNCARDKSSQKRRYNDNLNEKKMALVRQKFIEAKHLATDDKLRHSKQFQDALEVLSSNKDLFIKFLQEQNSLFSQHVHNLQSIPPPPETKRITVLKPSNLLNNENIIGSEKKKNERLIKKTTPVRQLSGRGDSGLTFPVKNWKVDDDMSRPTQIVVLRPSPGKYHDSKTVISPPYPLLTSPMVCTTEELYGEQESEEAQESTKVGQEIKCEVQDNLSWQEKDENLLSVVFSNCYIDNESTFNKSLNECAAGNLSDSEVMSPASMHSWDYTNRFGSPYSLSSFSHVSCSSESSVCREAKKRLAERWAMITSNGSYHEQRYVGRRSSTLAEMLALSDVKKSVVSKEEDRDKNQEPKDSTTLFTSELINDGVSCAPGNILRSKSAPASSIKYNNTRLDVEVSNSEVDKANVLNEVTKPRSTKLSFKGKISSLFFPRNKKSSEDKSCALHSKSDLTSAAASVHSPRKTADDRSRSDNDVTQDEDLSLGLHGTGKVSSPDLVVLEQKQSKNSPETGLYIVKPLVPGNSNENQEQPSPISVLDPLFGEDDQTTSESSGNMKPSQQDLLVHANECRLIDKSPPIGSIARTLSWDESSVCFQSSFPLQPNLAAQGVKEDEQEWFFFVHTLLSAARLNGKPQSDTFMVRWHSPESPLDPSLRDKYLDLKFNDIPNAAKQKQRRTTQKLVFDCVNAALVDITGYGSETCQLAIPYDEAYHMLVENDSFMVTDLVWAQIKDWFSGELICENDCEDSYVVVVERAVRKETVGRGWVGQLRFETDYIRKEIEVKILGELVQEAVVELSSRV